MILVRMNLLYVIPCFATAAEYFACIYLENDLTILVIARKIT